LGDGFVLSHEEARELLEATPASRDVVQPFLNGEDLSRRPDQSPSRQVINFHDWSIDEARNYPACWEIVDQRVRPERQRRNDQGDYVLRRPLPERFWQYADKRPALYRDLSGLSRALVGPQTAKFWSVSFVPTGWVYSHALTVFAFEDDARAAVLSSTFHDAWARKYSGSLKFDLRYSPTDCFENFAFPADLDSLPQIGERYLSHRKATMLDQDQGLTTVYNRVHEQPEDVDPAIVKLRSLRRELDRAVADAYGWADLELELDFRETPLGLRYTIDEPTKAEALDRLLELNHERHAEEAALGLHDGKHKKPRRPRKPEAPPASQPGGGGRLFADG